MIEWTGAPTVKEEIDVSHGAGKYSDVCNEIRQRLKAKGVIVIVFDGISGSGISVESDLLIADKIPALVEEIMVQYKIDFNLR